MIVSITFCLAALVFLLWLLRRDRISLGLPVAYLFSLLLIHVPGAFAHVVAGGLLPDSDLTAIGIRFAAIASVCFVAGVWLARAPARKRPIQGGGDRSRFCLFCLLGGWCVTYAETPLRQFPSIDALVIQGGYVWMLGVILGLRAAVRCGNVTRAGLWLAALAVYPLLMLLVGGFLTWGSMTAIIVLSVLTVSTRSYRRVAAGLTAATLLGLGVFVNYMQHRDEIRDQVWGKASLEARLGSVVNAFRHFEWFDPANSAHLYRVDERLNQNYFVGLAAERLQLGEVGYLSGATIWDGVLGLVPRVLWPEKPVSNGSGRIVANMTGLQLSETTSFGVGQVMEFHINFGIPGLIVGFLLLGWLTGWLDLKAAVAEREGDLGRSILYFLPAVALISPNGSLVDLSSAFAAGLVAALGWSQAWKRLSKRRGLTARRGLAIPALHYENLTYRN